MRRRATTADLEMEADCDRVKTCSLEKNRLAPGGAAVKGLQFIQSLLHKPQADRHY